MGSRLATISHLLSNRDLPNSPYLDDRDFLTRSYPSGSRPDWQEIHHGLNVHAASMGRSVWLMGKIREGLEQVGGKPRAGNDERFNGNELPRWSDTNSSRTGRELLDPELLDPELKPVLPHVSRQCLNGVFQRINQVAYDLEHLVPGRDGVLFSGPAGLLSGITEMNPAPHLDQLCELCGI